MTKKQKNEQAAALGRIGGKALSRKRGKAYMSKIGRRGAKARWGNKKKSK